MYDASIRPTAPPPGGRRAHLICEVVDLFMIPVYVLLYASTIAYAARRLFGQGTRLALWGVVIPLLAGLVDYGEDRTFSPRSQG